LHDSRVRRAAINVVGAQVVSALFAHNTTGNRIVARASFSAQALLAVPTRA
jgi:hypothetical protein